MLGAAADLYAQLVPAPRIDVILPWHACMKPPYVCRSTAFLSALTKMEIVKLITRSSWYVRVLVCIRPARVYLPLHPPHFVSLYMSLGTCAFLRTVQIEGIFARADADGSSEIDYEEFMVSGTGACCCCLTGRED